jgi:hypothetical protein
MQARPLYGPDQPKTTVTELAHEFRRVVRGHFFDATNFPCCDEDGTPHPSYIKHAREQQAKLRAVDAKHAADADSNVCYLADHYDSNEFMMEAWDNVAGCALMAGSWVHANLTNDAWEAARGMGFAWPDDNDLPRPCPDCGQAGAYNYDAEAWEHVGNHECFLAGPGQYDAQYAADPCDSCGDAAVVDFISNGQRQHRLCQLCFDHDPCHEGYTLDWYSAKPDCEDAGCSEHGIDAMPERWAKPDPVVQVLCDCGAHSECPESQVPDECPGCGEQPLFNHIEPKDEARAYLISAMNEAIDGLNILNAQFDLQQVEDIMLDPAVDHFNPLPTDYDARHPLSALVDAMRKWRDNLADPSLAWAGCAGCQEYVVEAGVPGVYMEGMQNEFLYEGEWFCPKCFVEHEPVVEPCQKCGEDVVAGEHHGEGEQWLCGDCYGAQ